MKSLINNILERSVKGQPTPTVGMGVTFLHFSDRDAGTIIEVFNVGERLYIKTQDDFSKRTDKNGMSESQTYEYTPNPNGHIKIFRKREDEKWEFVAMNFNTLRYNKINCGLSLHIGKRKSIMTLAFKRLGGYNG